MLSVWVRRVRGCRERRCDDNVGGGAGIRWQGSVTARAKRITAALSEREVKWSHEPLDKVATEWRRKEKKNVLKG